jgi:hypothetical protein
MLTRFTLPQIKKEHQTLAELMVIRMKGNHGSINYLEYLENINETAKIKIEPCDIFYAVNLLACYGLISKIEECVIELTDKGCNFTTFDYYFENERQQGTIKITILILLIFVTVLAIWALLK